MNYKALKAVLSYDEGNSNHPYKDHLGNWTIGIGHLIGSRIENLLLSDRVIDVIFQEDVEVSRKEALSIFGVEFFENLELARQIAIISLLFNMGFSNFLTFRKMIAAIKVKNWNLASFELLNSKWRSQVDPKLVHGKGRDDRISFMLQYGKIPDDYKIKP